MHPEWLSVSLVLVVDGVCCLTGVFAFLPPPENRQLEGTARAMQSIPGNTG